MGIRGRKRRLVLEDEYWALILSGVGAVEACQMVGIGRKTGYRWRAELGGLVPARRGEAQQSERYLSLLERERIAVLRRQGLSMRAIATRLGRAPSTISPGCGATPPPTTAEATTRCWFMPGPARPPDGTGPEYWPTTRSSVGWCSPSSSWTGPRSRSPCACRPSSRTARSGMCATRRSIRRSITAPVAGCTGG